MNQIDIGNDKIYKDKTQEYLDDEINRINETIINKIENISNVNRNYYSNKNNEPDRYSEEKEYKAFENDLNNAINYYGQLEKRGYYNSLIRSEPNIMEYISIVRDILSNEDVIRLKDYEQHKNCSRYNHCLSVSFITYVVTKKANLDYKSAARGAMLHDLYFYDWHEPDPTHRLHGFTHPKVALDNAIKLFNLNDIEKDIIVKHMWPLTIKFPSYTESYIVTLVDKYCAAHEVIRAFMKKFNKIRR